MDENDRSNTPTPTIVSPVAGSVHVSDIGRSLAFYRDVLQFERPRVLENSARRRSVEISRGSARVQLHADRDATPAILFFEADDLPAIRAAIKKRGGMPSEILRVNWLDADMFEVRDPDGNTLWFGRAIGEPIRVDHPTAESGMRQASPEFPLNDVRAGIEHYRDVFGFRTLYANNTLGVMERDRVVLALIARTSLHTGIGSAYVYTANVDELHAELIAKGANVLGEPISHPWGIRDFAVLDLEGNRIRFAQEFEQLDAGRIKIVSRYT